MNFTKNGYLSILAVGALAAAVTMGGAVKAAPTDYLHYWHPSRATNSVDYGPGGKNGTINGSVTVGSEGWWLKPTGDGTGYLSLPGPIANTTSYSFSFWGRPDKTAMDARLYGGWVITDRSNQTGSDDWQVTYSKTFGAWRMNYYNTGGTGAGYTGSAAVHDVWTHVAVTVTGAEVVLYTDGVAVTTATAHGTPNDAYTGNAMIGGSSWGAGPDTQYRGYLDNLKFYQRALNATEVNALYAAGRLYTPPSDGRPSVVNGVATNILFSSVSISGTLLTNGLAEATVVLYCATTDCTTNEAAWIAAGAIVTNLGPFSRGVAFTNTLTGLASNTVYYWNHNAFNASGSVWAATSESPSFKTRGPPAVDIGAGATAVGVSTVNLNGNLTNGAPANVFFDWWADGSDITNRVELGAPRELGAFSANLTGLTPSTDYRYQAMASNVYGTAVTEASDFTTLVSVVTGGNVTWSGAGEVPFWDVPANWAGNAAPANPSPATVTFDSAGQAVNSFLETDRHVHRLALKESSVATAHTINLGGYTLTVTNQLFFTLSGGNSNNRRLTFRNGTLRMGTETSAATMNVDRSDVVFGTGGKLHPLNLDTLSLPTGLSRNALLDLRGAEVVGGTLEARVINLSPGRGYGSCIYINGATAIDSIHVRGSLIVGDGMSAANNTLYIGNPSDLVTLDDRNVGRLPAGIDLLIGVSTAQRAGMTIGNISYADNAKGYAAIRVAPGGGGSFTGYIGTLRIGTSTAGANGVNAVKPRGMLHLAAMDSCLLDVTTINIATARTAAESTDDHRGELWLPTGVVTAGTVRVGANATQGRGFLSLSNTAFTVTNSLTLNTTGEVVINRGGTPTGIDIEQALTDSGGTIHVNFLSAPDIAGSTNWAVRVRGDAHAILSGMVGSGRLTSDGAFAGWKTSVLNDDTYTYFAMVDESLASPPTAVAKDAAFHIEPGGTVLVDISEVDNGSYDPSDRTPVAITMSKDGLAGPFGTNLSLHAIGDYEVTVKIEVGNPVEASATTTATVSIVDLPAPTSGDVTWSGGAGTALMARREWFWPKNWAGGQAPANPTGAAVIFGINGQSVTGLLDADRRIRLLNSQQGGVAVSHVIDLGGYILTATNGLSFTSGGGVNQLTIHNGTLQVGDEDAAVTLFIDRSDLIVGTGGVLDARGVESILLPTQLSRNALLDLRGAEVVGGTIDVRELTMTAYRGYGSRFFLNGATGLDLLAVRETFVMGEGWANGNGPQYIGNPSDGFTLDGRSLGRYPAGVDLRFGVDTAQRANVTIVDMNLAQNNQLWAAIRVAPGGGGSFTGYINTLRIGTASAGYNEGNAVKPRAVLHVAEMDACHLDVKTLHLATARAAVEAGDDHQGELRLGPGTAVIGTAVIGADAPLGQGLLSLSNTVCTVTNALTLHKTADVRIQVGEVSSGLNLTRNDALSLDPDAAISVTFHAAPQQAGAHYGLRLAGDHMEALTAMCVTGRLTIDSKGLKKPAEIFLFQGATCVGIPPSRGTLILLR